MRMLKVVIFIERLVRLRHDQVFLGIGGDVTYFARDGDIIAVMFHHAIRRFNQTVFIDFRKVR